jgi:pimeloyl-ACP methyl ester carboxylesterase
MVGAVRLRQSGGIDDRFRGPTMKTLAFATPAGTTTLTGPASAAPATRYLQVGGGRIAYDDTGGSGPIVLALPGMGDVRAEYRFLRPLLQQAGYRVVTMDVRGMGETSAVWYDYSARAVGTDAISLVDALRAGPAVILGTSFAAGAALWAAHEAPGKVRGAVLLGPVVRDYPLPWYIDAAAAVAFAGPWRRAFWLSYWNSLFKERRPEDHAAYRAALAANLREPGRMAALRAMVRLSKASTEAMLSQSRVPALIVMGGTDPDFPDPGREASWLAAQLRAESMVIERVGHYPHVEQPYAVGTAIIAFMNRRR